MMTTLKISPDLVFQDPAYQSLSVQSKQEIANMLVALSWLQKQLAASQEISNQYLKLMTGSQQSVAPGMRWLIVESNKYEQAANSVLNRE